MRQLVLDLGAAKPQTLDTFVAGHNGELLQRLRGIAQGTLPDLNGRFIYLWGEAGSGKSHLLHALAEACGGRVLGPDATEEDFAALSAGCCLIDDCDRLSPTLQIAAFALFNRLRESGGLLVTAGSLPPARLDLREDLRTRLGWGLIYEVHGLTDEEKIDALTQAARARGVAVSPGVLPYLITHFRRDMRSLSAMLDALDAYSLETQRPITVPLLRSLLQLGDDPTS